MEEQSVLVFDLFGSERTFNMDRNPFGNGYSNLTVASAGAQGECTGIPSKSAVTETDHQKNYPLTFLQTGFVYQYPYNI